VTFVDFFIRRVVFALVCAILVVLAGGVIVPTLPVEQYPQIAPPRVSVSAFYPGASGSEVESSVTIPLEQAINGVQDMRYITSSSSNDGRSSISVIFEPTRNIDLAAIDVQARVNSALPRLPADVRAMGVSVDKSSDSFVAAAALLSDDNRYDEKFMSNYADVVIRDALKRVRGVSDVAIFGERRFSMRLWLDPSKLASRGLSPNDVVNALREQNVQVAAGTLGLPPSREGLAYQISVRAVGRLVDAREFDEIIVRAQADGTIVRLRDVGRAELGAESYSLLSSWRGHRTVGLGIMQRPGSNALEVRREAATVLERLAKEFPPGLKYEWAFDVTEAMRASIHEVLVSLAEAIALVILTILVFLQSWRTTLIPTITIPVSLVGTFIFVKLFGFSINMLTLFGLTLATGLVVDDAIVVIENISRFIEEKKLPRRKAASVGMAEVTSAVVATSLVLVAVFVPVAFFPGTTGRIYQQFSLTIAFSIALSAFNALTLAPALAARLLTVTAAEEKNVFCRGFDRVLDLVRRGYARALAVVLRHRAPTLVAFVALLGLTAWVFDRVPRGFVPEDDEGWFMVIVNGPEGTSLDYNAKVFQEIDKIVATIPEIRGCFDVPGNNGPNRGTIYCSLWAWQQRRQKGSSLEGVFERLQPQLDTIGGANVILVNPPALPGGSSGFALQVEDQSSNPTVDRLATAMNSLVAAGNQDPLLTRVYSSFTANDPQAVVTVDREKAKALDVSLDEVFSTLQVFLGSEYVNDFVFGTRTYRVFVQADEGFRDRPKDIEAFYVRSRSGEMVPLGVLANVTMSSAPQSINHYNLFRSVAIQGAARPGVSSGQAIIAMEKIARKNLPAGMAFEWSATSQEQIDSGRQTVYTFLLGLIFVFLVLAAQYESFVLPLIIVLAVPIALLGALLMQWARGYANDLFCQVGLVMLIGLASKNAILIVEFAKELREQGRSIVRSALEAAETRLRPILMTSIAFLIGVVPMLLASGAGAASRHSLGTAVFGGMLVSTMLNLFFIPALYVVVESLRERIARRTAPVHAAEFAAPPPTAQAE
jgi:HAE1 family hydrophobic/amphiphilic exporter-1